MNETSERDAIAAEALSWMGTPFRHQQAIKGSGVDCLTLVRAVFATISPELTEMTLPPYRPDEFMHRTEERYADGLSRYFAPMGRVNPEIGDVLSFQFGRRAVAHCGICVDADGGFVSALMVNGQVQYGRLRERGWAQRWSGTWRWHRWAIVPVA